MPPAGRVRESCAACRKRKSRCDGEQPCSPCVIRQAGASCTYKSRVAQDPTRPPSIPHSRASTPASVSGHGLPYPRRRSSSPPSLRASSSSVDWQPKSTSDAELMDRARWRDVLAVLPPKPTVEILLEYLLVECDWFCDIQDTHALWIEATTRQGVTRAQAGLLLISLSLSAILLGDPEPLLYRPGIQPNEHVRLYELARKYLAPEPQTVEELDLYFTCACYCVYSGRDAVLAQTYTIGLPACLRLGLLDETTPMWDGLSRQERETRRRVARGWLAMIRWNQLHLTRNPLEGIRINSCRPSLAPIPIHTPISLALPPCKPEEEPSFRILRIRSPAELHRVEVYRNTLLDITEILPRAQAHCVRHDEAQRLGLDREPIIAECQVLNHELNHWLEVGLPQAGFPAIPDVASIDTRDLVGCRYIIQGIFLRLVVSFILSNILRPWLEDVETATLAYSPSPNSTTPRGRLQTACLDNARRVVGFISHINLFLSQRHSPLVTPFIAANMFNAATSFAIPVLRAVTHHPASPFRAHGPSSASSSTGAASGGGVSACPSPLNPAHERECGLLEHTPTETEVKRLPVWPDGLLPPRPHGRYSYPPSRRVHQPEPLRETVLRESNEREHKNDSRLPRSIYADETVRECAEHILVVLDVLSRLNASPLGKSAERRLSALITQYGLRDSQDVPRGVIQPSPDLGAASNNMQQYDDLDFLDELLQMQPSIWEGLFAAGALTART